MGKYYLRARNWLKSKAATTSAQPSDTKNNSRKKRDRSAQPGNASLINPLEKSAETASEEPPVTRACPSEANADFNSPPQDQPSHTMRPIGEYPTLAEYKSVGLKPAPRYVREQRKLAARIDEDGDDLMTDAPITPVGEEIMDNQITCLDQQSDKFTDGLDPGTLNTSIEPVMGKTMGVKVNVQVNEDGPDNLASPISELFNPLNPHLLAPSSTHTSPSPLDTPVETPIEELNDPIMAPSKKNKKGNGSKKKTPTNNTLENPPHSPSVTATAEPATGVGEPDASDAAKIPGRNYVSVLKYLPQPTSSTYNVPQLRKVLESAIARAKSNNDDDVALSLLYYWSQLHADPDLDFKLSLIRNMGLKKQDRDHQFELALQTFLRHQQPKSVKWYKNFIEAHARAGSLDEDKSDDEVEKPPVELDADGNRKLKIRFKLKDMYRDTSGSKLEEQFVTGKTNTVPLKRARKPCPANENSFQRRFEWEADENHDENVRNKRARFEEAQPEENPSFDVSDIRPHGQEVEIPQPDLPPDPDIVMSPEPPNVESEEDEASEPEPAPAPARGRLRAPARGRGGARGRGNARGRGRGRGGTKPLYTNRTTVLGRSHIPDPVWWPELKEDSDGGAPSNSVYSNDRSSDWQASVLGSRHHPGSMERGLDNVDNCTICDEGGELMCCETCQNAFHRDCLSALDRKGERNKEWFCPVCDAKHTFTYCILESRSGKKTEFSLSPELREHFAGVEEWENIQTLQFRTYQEVPHIPRLTKPPSKPLEGLAYMEYLCRYVDNGHAILCTKCSKHSGGNRPIIPCDYCSCRFHMDCLDPPMVLPPGQTRGWMCPNHVSPSEMVSTKVVDGKVQERRIRRPKKLNVVDVDALPVENDEPTFHDDWRESRLRTPAHVMIMDFIGRVKEDRKQTREAAIEQIKNRFVNITTLAVEDLVKKLDKEGAKVPEGWLGDFRSLCESEAHRVREGSTRDGDADAAESLLALSRTQEDEEI